MCKKGHYVLLQDLVVFEFFTMFCVITQNQTELQSSKLHPNCTKDTNTAEVTFICTFLPYGILRITGNVLYSSLICFCTSVNTRQRQSYTLKACYTLRTGTFSMMSSTLKGKSHLEAMSSIMELEKLVI